MSETSKEYICDTCNSIVTHNWYSRAYLLDNKNEVTKVSCGRKGYRSGYDDNVYECDGTIRMHSQTS